MSTESEAHERLTGAASQAEKFDDVRSAFFRHTAQDDTVAADSTVRQHLDLAAHRTPADDLVAFLSADPQAHTGPALLVVTDDMPLLVDALSAVVESAGVPISHFLHPVLSAIRTPEGDLVDLQRGSTADDSITESWMRIEFAAAPPEKVRDRIIGSVRHTLLTLRQITADAPAMADRQHEVAAAVNQMKTLETAPWGTQELGDTADLLDWLRAGNFTFLGYQYCTTDSADGADRDLGLVRATDGYRQALPVWAPAGTTALITVAQAPEFSAAAQGLLPHMISVADFDGSGIIGEHRFLGLFTVTALHENVLDIPVLARRARDVIARAGYRLESHSGQALLEIIQDYPRPELFAIDGDDLYRTVVSVLGAAVRQHLLLFLRPRTGQGVISALVYLPRDRYTTGVRRAMQNMLLAEFDGSSIDHTVRVTESPLALVHFTIRTDQDTANGRDVDWGDAQTRMQQRLTVVSRTWDDDLHDTLRDEDRARTTRGAHYAARLPESYKQDFAPRRAAADLTRLENLDAHGIDVQLYPRRTGEHTELRLTLYVAGERVSLSEVLPILHSLGVDVLDERPYPVVRPDGLSTWIYDFGLHHPPTLSDLTATGDRSEQSRGGTLASRFCETFVAAWSGAAEVDSFNTLVARAGLTWSETAVLRAYAKYLRQAGFPHSTERIAGVLVEHPQTVGALVRLFAARFDPEHTDIDTVESLTRQITEAVDDVVSLEADRILRAYLNLLSATVRTNYYRRSNPNISSSSALALKFEPAALSELPQPRPQFEVFVYSPEVEGVHLRFGLVARGGLRWSDRIEDFRTEILGLVKAQAVKNAVIVPVGAKGGFVVKRPPTPTGDAATDRDALRDRGIACYRAFIGALLDVTDNVAPATGDVVPPPSVVRRDGDDPYLVVAADKGTATFSDEANAVAQQYRFWLGDAFASGGSVGYDHKAMGITAKGTWESVKRHFLEMGIDTQTEDCTAAGVGDMSGDVFGNGMLLSEHIRLVAAFDHRHIFLDPEPDAAASYRERRRLFELPRSSWDDYDRSLISAGGGIFARTAKSIPLSNQIREALGLAPDILRLSPQELVTAILRAPVDLLWNGGIGTYIKSSGETHLDVGDKANDGVRVDATEVRARVIGEGGNLGVTALGRIEFARAGGRINTDALDNSAGVDCSDHEVNIKILLDGLVSTGRLDAAAREGLLRSMTDDVEDLVLADNVAQNDLLGTSRATAASRVRVHARQIRALVAGRGLDRALEALPDDDELERRAKQGTGLTSPELATLTAHVKLALKTDLLAGDLPDGDAFTDRLLQYFPERLRRDYADAIGDHRLRREIIATVVTNEVIDTGGISYVFRLGEDLGASSTDAVRAYAAASAIVGLPALVQQIRQGAPNTAVSDLMITEVRRLLDRVSRWLLNHRPQPIAIGAEIARYGRAVEHLMPKVPGWLQGPDAAVVHTRATELTTLGAPPDQATAIVSLLHGFCAVDIIDIADLEDRDVDEVAELYYTLNAHLSVDYLLTAISGLDDTDRWNALARLALRDDVYSSMRLLTLDALSGSSPAESAAAKITDWEATNTSRLTRARAILAEIFDSNPADLATLSVAARQVRTMVGRSRPQQPTN
ncbi:NAD-glutamate dehydrogenase (plasmid) [Rhodococcus pseudokoreensis]|uniref:NAD-glutamate dehydrogenase n=1 Tax=Rhodococcus pseudokoreensis TaxID=2811421 RepID=A0A974VYF5_9NOCA|nr:NAD-glutamate dehydrogenase [Rhodococcus pseudokoreensis]QSE87484.1 NAD-glutamate dehydrogenase [Rhodococcus pseudokoreensis]